MTREADNLKKCKECNGEGKQIILGTVKRCTKCKGSGYVNVGKDGRFQQKL